MIDLFEEVDREVPLNGRRWVLGHISALSPRDIERVVRMGLVITTHTNRYIFKEGPLLQKRLPPERHAEIAPIRSLVDAGVSVALATDNVPVSLFWPVWQTISRMNRYTNQPVARAGVDARASDTLRDLQRRILDVRRKQKGIARGGETRRPGRIERRPDDG